MLKNSNKKGKYVNGSKLHQLGWYGDLFRTKAVLNTFPVDNIDIKEIIGLYECFLLARILFDANGLPNNGGDGKSNLVHAVTNSIDGASIHPWRGKLNVSVIVAIGTIFHLPLSIKFESFKYNLHQITLFTVFVFWVILVRIFPHSDWIRIDTESFRVQSKCRKIHTRITSNTDTFYAVIN